MFYLAQPKPDPEPDKKPEADEPDDPGLPVELQRILNQRRDNLLDEGWPEDEATELAALFYVDWHDAAAMRRNGCSFEFILRILT